MHHHQTSYPSIYHLRLYIHLLKICKRLQILQLHMRRQIPTGSTVYHIWRVLCCRSRCCWNCRSILRSGLINEIFCILITNILSSIASSYTKFGVFVTMQSSVAVFPFKGGSLRSILFICQCNCISMDFVSLPS